MRVSVRLSKHKLTLIFIRCYAINIKAFYSDMVNRTRLDDTWQKIDLDYVLGIKKPRSFISF